VGSEGQVYKCRFLDEDIEIGRNFDDPAWAAADPVPFYLPGSLEQPISKTEAGLLWSRSYLYVCFKAYDKDVFARNTERDSVTCRDDVLEVFFKPLAQKDTYYNFEINALNTVYDACNPRQGAGGHDRWCMWDCKGLKSAVYIKGTINDPTDVDEYWMLQVGVPFSELDLGGKVCPESGDQWRFHLSRYDYSVYLPGDGTELSSSAKLTKVDFHYIDDWGTLEFVR